MTPQEIISDDEIARVHGNANFGAMDPREVVNDGVRKTAVGYHCGSTQLHILRDHGLVTKPRPGSSDAGLTKKGKAYARSIYRDTNPARAEAQEEGAAGEPVAWREIFIVEEEGGAAVGIVIDLPDGSQIWTGECSTQLLEDARAREESPEASGQYLIVAAKGEPTRVIAQVATVDDGIALARAIAGHIAAHPSPTPAADADRVRIAVEALEPFVTAASGRIRADDPDNDKPAWAKVSDYRRAAEALAALKSTAAKEGGSA